MLHVQLRNQAHFWEAILNPTKRAFPGALCWFTPALLTVPATGPRSRDHYCFL